MDWQSPAIILSAQPYGEGDALVTVLTPESGAWRGLAKGGASRSKAAIWQVGNLISASWVARLSDQLGAFTGELVHPAAALAMEDRVTLAILKSACAGRRRRAPRARTPPRLLHRPRPPARRHRHFWRRFAGNDPLGTRPSP